MSNETEATTPVISCEGLSKSFRIGPQQINIFQDINFTLNKGEQVGIVGASGAGKSTFLHLLGGLEKPSAGQVLVQGKGLHKISERARCRLRNEAMGFIYQFHHILPEFTVLENVCMPLLIRGESPALASEQATAILAKVGLEKRLAHKLSELSGGERSRTAIARALVTKPACVLADEPTGNLDEATAATVYDTMLELNHDLQTSLLIVTHDKELARKMDRVYSLHEGHLTPAS